MTMHVGHYSLVAAMLTAAAMVLACALAVRFSSGAWLNRARWLMALFVALLCVSSAALLTALVQSDFRLSYVASYTERALPTPYKLAAFWAGQEGSILLWAWMIALMALIAVVRRRNKPLMQETGVTATLAIVCGFFTALLLFAADPFAQASVVVPDGRGLNPLLQDPAMVAHPPFLFLGYAGFTVPFAVLIGALLAKQPEPDWIASTRKWLLSSWLFLTVGILLGAQWAYIELGWGGYWAWDPVENASLLPWLTATALLHSIMAQQQRDLLKKWTAGLIVASFWLCIFGTYLTRSGINSVHSFGASAIGTFFLSFFLAGVLLSAAIIFWRRKLLRTDRQLDSLLSKEGLFLAVNVLLTLITAVTLVGTIFPLISEVFVGRQVSVGPPFYNMVVLPLALALLALMAAGPLLNWGADGGRKLIKRCVAPAVPAVIGLILAAALGLRDAWSLACTGIACFAAGALVIDLVGAAWNRVKLESRGLLSALLETIDASHRRYGGQLVHVGMIMIMIGVAGSSLFGVKEDLKMVPGQSLDIAGRTFTLHELAQVRRVNYDAVEARLTMTQKGKTTELRPQTRFYDKSEQPNSEVALQWSLQQDVYVTLAGWEPNGRSAAIQVRINPLVTWIWVGGIVMTLGALFGLTPRLLPGLLAGQTPARGRAGLSLPITAVGATSPPGCCRNN